MKSIIVFLMILSMVFITSADITPTLDNICSWQIITKPTVQFTFGLDTQSTLKNNILEIIYFEKGEIIGNLSINLQSNETHIEPLSLQALSSCTWKEYWYQYPSLSPDDNYYGKEVLITNVTIGTTTFTHESRIWKNENREHDDTTLSMIQ